MNYIKKIIYFIITLSFTLIVFSTLILFFYAAFFFEPPAVERKTEENQITKSEESSTLPIEEVEPKKEIVKVDVSEVEEVIVDVPEVEEVIKDSLFATVGNKAITQSDIINEIKIILILTGQSFTEDIKDQLQAGAIRSTISRNIKKIEIEKYDYLTFNLPDVDKELKKLAVNLYMDIDTFENTIRVNEEVIIK